MTVINYQALTQPLTEQMITQYCYTYGIKSTATGTPGASFWITMTLAALVGCFGVAAIALGGEWGSGLTLMLVAVVFAAVVFGTHRHAIQTQQEQARFYQFAKDNKLHYWPITVSPNHTGMMFGMGDTRTARHQFFTTTGRIFEFGNYSYMTGSGKSRTTHRLGYISIYLDRNLPHMVLDSRKNNVGIFGANFSNLPVAFDKDQVLSLEGDFNNHFTLYAPKDYETDALYVFAPDLMALMIDKVSSFDAEIIDDRLYVYSLEPFNFMNIQIMERLFGIVTVVAAKTARQTARYKDTRATDNSALAGAVAAGGQRLRRGTPLAAIIIVAGIVGLIIVNAVWLMYQSGQ